MSSMGHFKLIICWTNWNQFPLIHLIQLYASKLATASGWRLYVFGLSICPSVPFLTTQYVKTSLGGFLQIWYKRSLGLKDELKQMLWSKFKGDIYLTNHVFGFMKTTSQECLKGISLKLGQLFSGTQRWTDSTLMVTRSRWPGTSCTCECDISATTKVNFITSATYFIMDSGMTWRQMSKSLWRQRSPFWHMNTLSLQHLEIMLLNLAQMFPEIRGLTD